MTVNTGTTPIRDPFMPRTPKGLGPGLALALLAHALLIAGLAYSVDWRTREPASVEAELWAAVPQLAAPRATASQLQTQMPTPTPLPKPPVATRQPEPAPLPPPPPIKAEPTPRPKPAVPPPAPLPDPQIAIEKAKAAKRLLAQRELAEQEQVKRTKELREKALKVELERAKDEQARKKLLAEKSEKAEKLEKDKAEKEKAEKAAKAKKAEKADAIQEAANRDANLKRLQGLADATGTSASTGAALKSSGPSASYAGRIMARIKPNLVFTESADGNPTATVEVKLAPDGTIIGKRLLQSSGVKAWDDAVLRALDRTEMLPRDIDGRVPPPFPIVFRLRD